MYFIFLSGFSSLQPWTTTIFSRFLFFTVTVRIFRLILVSIVILCWSFQLSRYKNVFKAIFCQIEIRGCSGTKASLTEQHLQFSKGSKDLWQCFPTLCLLPTKPPFSEIMYVRPLEPKVLNDIHHGAKMSFKINKHRSVNKIKQHYFPFGDLRYSRNKLSLYKFYKRTASSKLD